MAVKVIVKRGQQVVEELSQRPLRVMPDRNTAAVVYNRKSYPLRCDSLMEVDGWLTAYIDLNDVAAEKDETTFPRSGAKLVRTGQAKETQINSTFDLPLA